MHRTVALLGLVALSGSQGIALHCDMGSGSEHHADAPAKTRAQHQMPGQPSPPPHDQGHAAGDCLMIMTCGSVSIRPVRSAAMVRFPAVLVQTGFSPPAIPVAADLAVETPPPRLAA